MASSESDERLEILGNIIIAAFRSSEERWSRLLSIEENYKTLTEDFLNHAEYKLILVGENAAGGLTVTAEPDLTSLPAKSVFVLKILEGIVTRDNIRKALVFGDLSPNTLEQLRDFLDQGLMKFLCNVTNHEGWSRELMSELSEKIATCRNLVDRVISQEANTVFLSFPPIILNSSKETDPDAWLRNVLRIVETTVCQWMEQIEAVLIQNSYQSIQTRNKFPEPGDLVEFWKEKQKLLKFIHRQLTARHVDLITRLLANSNSRYSRTFRDIIRKVEVGVDESSHLCEEMVVFEKMARNLEGKDIPRMPRLLPLLVHRVAKVWHRWHIKYPLSSSLVSISLLSAIGNIIIRLSQLYLDSGTLFREDLDDGTQKINLVVKVLKLLVLCYRKYTNPEKMQMFSPTSTDAPPNAWTLDENRCFERVTIFEERLRLILDIFGTASKFARLENIEIGGPKGFIVGKEIKTIFYEFQEEFVFFDKCPYDVLIPETQEFNKDVDKFRSKVEDFENRLVSLIRMSVCNCNTTEDMTKILRIFRFMLGKENVRSMVMQQCEDVILLKARSELRDVMDKFQMEKASFSSESPGTTSSLLIHASYPPTSRALRWLKDLTGLTCAPINAIRTVSTLFNKIEVVTALGKKQEILADTFSKLADSILKGWSSSVSTLIRCNLDKVLIIRNCDNAEIYVNFDEKLTITIREISHLLKLSSLEGIPKDALKLYQIRSKLQFYKNILQNIVRWYNMIKKQLITVEFVLFQSHIEKIDNLLKDGETNLKWSSEGILEYLKNLEDITRTLHSTVKKSQNNLKKIQEITGNWSKTSLFECSDLWPGGYHLGIISASSYSKIYKKFCSSFHADCHNIHSLLQESQNLIGVDTFDEGWSLYVSFVDEITCFSLCEFIRRNLRILMQRTNSEVEDCMPFFEITVDLVDHDLKFTPALESSDGFQKVFNGIISSIFEVTAVIPRVSKQQISKDYMTELSQLDDLDDMRKELERRVDLAAVSTKDIFFNLQPFSYLWKEKHENVIKNLTIGKKSPITDCLGILNKLKEQIISCNTTSHHVKEGVPSKILIYKWLQVDQDPFKNSLQQCLTEWSSCFKQHFANCIVSTLEELDAFLNETEQFLGNGSLKEEILDSAILVDFISHVQAVEDRKTEFKDIFPSLKEALAFLEDDSSSQLQSSHTHIQNLMLRWTQAKKLAEKWRHQISPMVAKEASIIRKDIIILSEKQKQFRLQFLKSDAFLKVCTDNVNLVLDTLEKDLNILKEEIMQLSIRAKLFEVHIPEFGHFNQCETDLFLLRQLWKYEEDVRLQIAQWEETCWTEVDLDALELQCKSWMRDIKGFDKEVRDWDCFSLLHDSVRNMLVALRSIQQLKNPTVRDRHWKMLTEATQIPFNVSYGKKTTLKELMSLELHQFEDLVESIVEKATKEAATERYLNDLERTWNQCSFDIDIHPRTGRKLLKVSENMIEMLEDNQVHLQNLLCSKHIGHFLKAISQWQMELGQVESIVSLWIDVQRCWMQMESIFKSSDDIQCRLPKDCERFEEIDLEFDSLVTFMGSGDANIKTVATKEGLFQRLCALQGQLELCEKALAYYIEAKRTLFPRFYFVSSADILDILSCGNQPKLVIRHLSKLFDVIIDLIIETKCSADLTSLQATAIVSKDGERLLLKGESFSCIGPVESWLSNLEYSIFCTLKLALSEAVQSYEDASRVCWIMEHPAQVILCGSQIWWVAEVCSALERCRRGYETVLKEYGKKQAEQLSVLINMLLGELSREDRRKIMTLCTLDVHSRDVVYRLISQKVEKETDFAWQSQLRPMWEEATRECFVDICDARFNYGYEYLGNAPRLVITPLTDRCFITLTQSLRLRMGGAPTGPAGTGKTETVKDLGKALGTLVYVFNCSEQMDYKSCAAIYKGLSHTGAWGCFDEFNRIAVEVLSVVAAQVKVIQDALRNQEKSISILEGEEVPLKDTVGIFITMNPDYTGRTELPENMKTLFRPCAMVVPDSQLICEILLVAEGFLEARRLGRKMATMYSLCQRLLSKQNHYDWGLRDIKAVLLVAGSLKRDDPSAPEDQVLMRALRDFNLPKLVPEDIPVFHGLISDLFPLVANVPRRQQDEVIDKSIREAIFLLKLQPEESFLLKVSQLEDLLEVRHSVFVTGGAGSGKTSVWKTLLESYRFRNKGAPIAFNLDPKAVSNDELFGSINTTTREWKDGLLSSLLRELVNSPGDGPKWLVLDGDIDPLWIESLNSVMDDNRVLTLASGERISLTQEVRLIFETRSLDKATPATVSRGGVLYLSPANLSWNPYVLSWIQKSFESEKSNLLLLFDKYVPSCLEAITKRFNQILSLPDVYYVQTLCWLLECVLTSSNVPKDSPKELYELYFVFCCIWSFGSCLAHDVSIGSGNQKDKFSEWFLTEFRTVKFPISSGEEKNTVFDFYVDHKRWFPWTRKLRKFQPSAEESLKEILVPTEESYKIGYILRLLVDNGYPVMLVGPSGVGKSSIIKSAFEILDSKESQFQFVSIALNFYSTSETLQKSLEAYLERKSGKVFGPNGQRKIIFCIDDFNAPEVDPYGTIQAHTLIRQHLSYGHWYDRHKLSAKEIRNCQYVATMNPTSGSGQIDPRLQRHFCVLSVSTPSANLMQTIFGSLLKEHLSRVYPNDSPIDEEFRPMQKLIISSAVTLHQKMSSLFPPTAFKFHYMFTLRDIANVFYGMLMSTADTLKSDQDLLKLWLHESQRAYLDKMVDCEDADRFEKLLMDVLKRNMDFDEQTSQSLLRDIPIYCHFTQGVGGSSYQVANDIVQLKRTVQDALDAYNDIYPPMELVLFDDALRHLCHISRIVESGCQGLLIGVGGVGKGSLASLAAYLSNLQVYQISLHSEYSYQDFKNDLAGLCLKTGLKNISIMFIIADAHLVDERFLVSVNDLLACGEISGLFPETDIENIVSAMRSEVKASGNHDSKENCWRFFINKVKSRLKIVLTFSPSGSTLRSRCRKFPALLSHTVMDWYHTWPRDALLAVSEKTLNDISILNPELMSAVTKFSVYAYESVQEVSNFMLLKERRNNEVTPKSFLQHLKMFNGLLIKKHEEMEKKVLRLHSGLQKLVDTSHQVDQLKIQLADQRIELQKRSFSVSELLEAIGKETEIVVQEKSLAAEEESNVSLINEQVAQRRKDCEEDLARAEPALVAAQEALDTLNKNNLTELRSFGAPPPAVRNVTAAVMILLAQDGKIPKDLSWRAAKLTMAKLDSFLDSLVNFDKQRIHENCLRSLQGYLKSPEFKPEIVLAKSQAAAGLCSWVINILKYYEVYCDVEPKRRALVTANVEYKAAKEKLCRAQKKVSELENKLLTLRAEYQQAEIEKTLCESETEQTAFNISLANRLLGGLASEQIRWNELSITYGKMKDNLPGDVLIASAFLSYSGPFPKSYRTELVEKYWIPFLGEKTELQLCCCLGLNDNSHIDPVRVLWDEGDLKVSQWKQCGLANDQVSLQNAVVFEMACETKRWPLFVDPQLQAILWIKNMYGKELKIVNLHHKGCVDILEKALTEGNIALVENIKEKIDPIIQPVINCCLVKKGRYLKFGAKEILFHPQFRLILHTKLGNPKFEPEVQAQTTVINFTVTQEGLADQLLSEIVSKERPDLEESKVYLNQQCNELSVSLKMLEDSLLSRLSSAEGQLAGDIELVENLEQTKKTAEETQRQVQEVIQTEKQINAACEAYRPAAVRAAISYFAIRDLENLNPIYLFSLKAFKEVYHKAIEGCGERNDLESRVSLLVNGITLHVLHYINWGLFEKDKLTFSSHLVFQILHARNEITADEIEFLLQSWPTETNVESPVSFISSRTWASIKTLSSLDGFGSLESDIEATPRRWKKLLDSTHPENESMPQDWRDKILPAQKLCILCCLRPDRMTHALGNFVDDILGPSSLRNPRFSEEVLANCDCHTAVLFIMSPGTSPLLEVEILGHKKGYTVSSKTLSIISLGQGQEALAELTVDSAVTEGNWVMLQNIHLVSKWLPTLEKKLDEISMSCDVHPSFRLFLTTNSPESVSHSLETYVPPGIVQSVLKIVNEPATGIRENLHMALDNFAQETLDLNSRDVEFRSLLFSLCYFHSVVVERKKFGSQGWNNAYPFSDNDLLISASILNNYLVLKSGDAVPFDDLRYLLGEIIYGGHITDDQDRILCAAYVHKFLSKDQLEQDFPLCHGFSMPPSLDIEGYHRYVEEHLPQESPCLYGLHPNAEIGYSAISSENLSRCLQALQHLTCSKKDSQNPEILVPGLAGSAMTPSDEKMHQIAEGIMEKLPQEFDMVELYAKFDSTIPFIAVGLQECRCLNLLLSTMTQSLTDMELGIKGELPITFQMEELGDALSSDAVPKVWENMSYPAIFPLGSWFSHFLKRYKALQQWVSSEFTMSSAIWLGGLFSPQSFLTAVIQTGGRQQEFSLDKLTLHIEVTKMGLEDLAQAHNDGAYISGLCMEGARWDMQKGCIMESFMKEVHPTLPVVFLKAALADKVDVRNCYLCPVYSTKQRRSTFVWRFPLPTNQHPDKWTIAGVAIVLNVE